MNLAEKIIALRAVFPFSWLKPEELLIVATAATPCEIQAGRVILLQGGTLQHLFIRVSGDLVNDADQPLHPIIGTTVLLTGCEVPYRIRSGPQGYRGLRIPRGKFLTIVNECPVLLVGFFRMPMVGRPELAFAQNKS